MATIREQIKGYLRIRDNIDEIVNAILNNNSINIIFKDMIEKNMVELTLKIVQEKNEHLKNKLLYETAMNDYAKRVMNEKQSTKAILAHIVEKYGLNCAIFTAEIFSHLSYKNYVYTRIIAKEGFTYAQEESLWQLVKWLVDIDFIPCTCRICFLLEASIHAYEYAKRWKLIKFYEHWNSHKAATIEWIQTFEMRHRDEISSLCNKLCKRSCMACMA